MDTRVAEVTGRFARVDVRFSRVEAEVDAVGADLRALGAHAQIEAPGDQLTGLDARFKFGFGLLAAMLAVASG